MLSVATLLSLIHTVTTRSALPGTIPDTVNTSGSAPESVTGVLNGTLPFSVIYGNPAIANNDSAYAIQYPNKSSHDGQYSVLSSANTTEDFNNSINASGNCILTHIPSTHSNGTDTYVCKNAEDDQNLTYVEESVVKAEAGMPCGGITSAICKDWLYCHFAPSIQTGDERLESIPSSSMDQFSTVVDPVEVESRKAAVAAACGSDGSPGICRVRPPSCPNVDVPVCACDGIVYTSECAAAAAGVNVVNEGPCIFLNLDPTNDSKDEVQVEDSASNSSMSEAKDEGHHQDNAAHDHSSESDSSAKSDDSDANEDDLSRGVKEDDPRHTDRSDESLPVEDDLSKPANDARCGLPGDEPCLPPHLLGLPLEELAPRIFCRLPMAAKCGQVPDIGGECRIVSANCPAANTPVCGCNGETFLSTCEATAAHVSVRHAGACTHGEELMMHIIDEPVKIRPQPIKTNVGVDKAISDATDPRVVVAVQAVVGSDLIARTIEQATARAWREAAAQTALWGVSESGLRTQLTSLEASFGDLPETAAYTQFVARRLAGPDREGVRSAITAIAGRSNVNDTRIIFTDIEVSGHSDRARDSAGAQASADPCQSIAASDNGVGGPLTVVTVEIPEQAGRPHAATDAAGDVLDALFKRVVIVNEDVGAVYFHVLSGFVDNNDPVLADLLSLLAGNDSSRVSVVAVTSGRGSIVIADPALCHGGSAPVVIPAADDILALDNLRRSLRIAMAHSVLARYPTSKNLPERQNAGVFGGPSDGDSSQNPGNGHIFGAPSDKDGRENVRGHHFVLGSPTDHDNFRDNVGLDGAAVHNDRKFVTDNEGDLAGAPADLSNEFHDDRAPRSTLGGPADWEHLKGHHHKGHHEVDNAAVPAESVSDSDSETDLKPGDFSSLGGPSKDRDWLWTALQRGWDSNSTRWCVIAAGCAFALLLMCSIISFAFNLSRMAKAIRQDRLNRSCTAQYHGVHYSDRSPRDGVNIATGDDASNGWANGSPSGTAPHRQLPSNGTASSNPKVTPRGTVFVNPDGTDFAKNL